MTLEIFAIVPLNLFQVLFGLGFLSDTHRAIYKNKYDILLLFDKIEELEVTIKKKRGTYYVVQTIYNILNYPFVVYITNSSSLVKNWQSVSNVSSASFKYCFWIYVLFTAMKSNPNLSLDLRKEIKTNKVSSLLIKRGYYYILYKHIYK